MAEVRLQALEKRFGALKALDGVTLTIAEGELFALLGSSGSGKTTALRCVAGLEHPDAGDVLIGGHSVRGRQPYERPIGMVFQSYALFPHLSVFDNVAYGLRARAYAQGGPLGKLRVLGAFVSRRLFPLLQSCDAGSAMRSHWSISRAKPTACPASFREACSSASRSLARSSPNPRCFCSTNRCRISTESCVSACARRSESSSSSCA